MREGVNFDRRTVLKTASAAAVVGAGTAASSTSAAAMRTKQELAAAYADEGELRAAFEQHGDDLVDALHESGVVDASFGLDDLAFDLDGDVTGLDPTDPDRLAGVTAVKEGGTFTAFGMVSTSSDTHEIALYVQPERGVAYARAEPKDGGDPFLVSGDGVSPEGCYIDQCGDACSCCCWVTRKTYSCDSNCENCYLYDTDCSCNVC